MILWEMFTYPFIVRAFVVGILVSVCAALLGVPLVLKRYSMIGDGLSHVSFGALSVAVACGWAPLPVSIPVVVIAALCLLRMTERSKLGADAAIAVVSASALAIGIIVTSLTTGMTTDVDSYMFGSILALSRADVALSVGLSVAVLGHADDGRHADLQSGDLPGADGHAPEEELLRCGGTGSHRQRSMLLRRTDSIIPAEPAGGRIGGGGFTHCLFAGGSRRTAAEKVRNSGCVLHPSVVYPISPEKRELQEEKEKIKAKKFCALLLALLLTMSLAACGGGAEDTNGPTPQKQFSAGTTTGNTYTNEYFGFTCTLDESWVFLDRDQISQVTGQVSDILDSDSLSDVYASGKVVIEMYAGNTEGSTVNVTVENLGVVNGAVYDEIGYVDVSLKSLPDQMTTAGYSDVSAEMVTMTFAGAQHYGISLSGKVNGSTLYETLVCIKEGNYMAVVTFATFGEDAADTMACFKAL